AGKILAQAGPCYVRGSNTLPVVGVMKFDEADIQNYINTGRFESIVLHEMNHVVGFGTIWTDKNLLQNAVYNDTTLTGNTNPRFTARRRPALRWNTAAPRGRPTDTGVKCSRPPAPEPTVRRWAARRRSTRS
ncbi:MAG: hypothetical protein H3C62_17050, partial [Gemmatimonadaceae bacterium]|nr:hypothetical protein [Gemmatimonadaceae bacterium]